MILQVDVRFVPFWDFCEQKTIGIQHFREAASELDHSLEMQKVYRHMARRFPGGLVGSPVLLTKVGGECE